MPSSGGGCMEVNYWADNLWSGGRATMRRSAANLRPGTGKRPLDMGPTCSERMIDVPGGRVWSGTYGAGTAVPLLVLHGGPGMPSYYLESLTDLGQDRPVVLYDQLGCGRSDRPGDASLWTVPRAVAEVAALRRGLGLERVHILGHSWGAFLALAYAKQHGDSLASLVLSSPLVSVAGWMEDASDLVTRLPDKVRQTIEKHERRGAFEDPAYVEATNEFYRRFFCRLDPWPPELERTFREIGEGPYHTMWGPSEFTQTGNLSGADLTPTLPRLPVPSLWLGGDHDEVSSDRLVGFAGAASGRAEIFEGGSHCLHLEQTSRYLEVVGAFLSDLERE
jgi:proline iminopeptidase